MKMTENLFESSSRLSDEIHSTGRALFNQIYQTGRGLSDQIHQARSGLSHQIHQTERELSITTKLEAGDASSIPLNCRNRVLQRNQQLIEENVELTDDTLKKLFSHGVIDNDEWSKIKAQKCNKGRTKVLLMIVDSKESTEVILWMAEALGETVYGNNKLLSNVLENEVKSL